MIAATRKTGIRVETSPEAELEAALGSSYGVTSARKTIVV